MYANEPETIQPTRQLTPAESRFAQSPGVRGPHLIPRPRQVSNQFHRIFSVKAGYRNVIAESRLEADAIFWAEGQTDVVGLTEQPIRINGSLGSRPYVTLDLGLVRVSGEETFYEIKPEARLIQDDAGRYVPEHWCSIEAWCASNGHRCEVLTDRLLGDNKTLIRNWRQLLSFVRLAKETDTVELSEHLVQILTDYPGLSLSQIPSHVAECSEQVIVASIAQLLHRGELTASLDEQVFTRHSPIRCVQ